LAKGIDPGQPKKAIEHIQADGAANCRGGAY
jgi:hypothetical protein